MMQPPPGLASHVYLWRVLKLLLAAGLLAGVFFLRNALAQDERVEKAKAHHANAQRAVAAGELAAAREELKKALELVPRFTEAQYLLGVVFSRAERWDDALAAYRAALEIGPEHPKHHYGIGCALRALGKGEDARASLEKARTLFDASRAQGGPRAAELARAVVEVDVQLAALARERGDEEGTGTILERALALEPGHPKLLAERGSWLLRRGDSSGAVAALEKAREAAPQDLAVLYTLGRALVAAGRADEGKARLDEYRREDAARREKLNEARRRGQAEVVAARAELELQDGRRDEARELARKALVLDPENARAKRVLGGAAK